MKERIVYIPNINTGGFVDNLALHSINTFNLKVIGPTELARLGFMRI